MLIYRAVYYHWHTPLTTKILTFVRIESALHIRP